jgi:hypothetical protein
MAAAVTAAAIAAGDITGGQARDGDHDEDTPLGTLAYGISVHAELFNLDEEGPPDDTDAAEDFTVTVISALAAAGLERQR